MKLILSSATCRRWKDDNKVLLGPIFDYIPTYTLYVYQVVQRTQQLLRSCPESLEASLSKETLTKVEQMVGQVLNIREVLGRQQVKVVFIGRTSSGKSTLINALLGEKVLPTGLGHTTSCFVQVKGAAPKKTKTTKKSEKKYFR